MTKLAEIRDIKLKLGNFTITNEEWLCPSCNTWSNSVEWFTTITPKETTKALCPKCKHKVILE
jgi:Zn finger protein HypA/HybF involved in hydrogenase expression